MMSSKSAKPKIMQTVKGQIQIMVILLVTISLLIVGGVSCLLNYKFTVTNAETALMKTAEVAAGSIKYQYQDLVDVVEVMGTIDGLSNEKTPLTTKRKILDDSMAKYKFTSATILKTDGKSIFEPTADFGDKNYFKASAQGGLFISDPVYSSASDELLITITSPLWKDGIRNSKVMGVVMVTRDAKGLSDIISDIKVSPNGAAYILNKEGTMIANENFATVEEGENSIKQAQTDPSMAEIAAIEQRMISGENGVAYQTFEGDRQIISFAQINPLSGWSLGVYAPLSDFTAGAIQSCLLTVILLIITIVIAVLIVHRLAIGIGVPVNKCANRISLLSEGDFKTPLPDIHTNNEIGVLVSATREHLGSLNTVLKDLDNCLDEIADGNFAVSSTVRESYVGDFEKVAISVEMICNRLNDTISQIDQVAEQVSDGSEQVSRDAQTLSLGATQQAESVAELFSSINGTADQIKKNSKNAVSAKEQADISGKNVEESNRQMQELVSAMHHINDKSNQISKIIKTIDDIAFQTNILALNAAVEAARAGEAGKGFAVVADEVRNLAGKSADAAKTTATLIAESIEAVENGTLIADLTASSMGTVVEGVRNVTSLIDEISDASNEQSNTISQILIGVEQISSVVETNSSTAQGSAAASEELSAQAQTLKALVGKFRLKEVNYSEF